LDCELTVWYDATISVILLLISDVQIRHRAISNDTGAVLPAMDTEREQCTA